MDFHINLSFLKCEQPCQSSRHTVTGATICNAKALSEKLNVCHTEISLDVDADRDGIVEKNNPNKVNSHLSLTNNEGEMF